MNPRAALTRPTPLAGAPLQPLEYFSRIINLYEVDASQRMSYYTHNVLSCQLLFSFFCIFFFLPLFPPLRQNGYSKSAPYLLLIAQHNHVRDLLDPVKVNTLNLLRQTRSLLLCKRENCLPAVLPSLPIFYLYIEIFFRTNSIANKPCN